MKPALRIIGSLGTLLFALLFSMTFGVPDRVEESAQGFVKTQIEKEIAQCFDEMWFSSGFTPPRPSCILQVGRHLTRNPPECGNRVTARIITRSPEKVVYATPHIVNFRDIPHRLHRLL